MVWSSCNGGMAAAAVSSIEGDRDHSMVVATTSRATTAITEIIGRIMGGLHVIKSPARSEGLAKNSGKNGDSFVAPRRANAALNSRAGFGKCGRRRLLHQTVENDSGSDSNKADDKACDHERAHRISPVLTIIQHIF